MVELKPIALERPGTEAHPALPPINGRPGQRSPKLRQNRFNCKNLTSKMLVYTSTDDEFVVFKEFRMTLLVFNPDSLVLWINARREMVC